MKKWIWLLLISHTLLFAGHKKDELKTMRQSIVEDFRKIITPIHQEIFALMDLCESMEKLKKMGSVNYDAKWHHELSNVLQQMNSIKKSLYGFHYSINRILIYNMNDELHYLSIEDIAYTGHIEDLKKRWISFKQMHQAAVFYDDACQLKNDEKAFLYRRYFLNALMAMVVISDNRHLQNQINDLTKRSTESFNAIDWLSKCQQSFVDYFYIRQVNVLTADYEQLKNNLKHNIWDARTYQSIEKIKQYLDSSLSSQKLVKSLDPYILLLHHCVLVLYHSGSLNHFSFDEPSFSERTRLLQEGLTDELRKDCHRIWLPELIKVIQLILKNQPR